LTIYIYETGAIVGCFYLQKARQESPAQKIGSVDGVRSKARGSSDVRLCHLEAAGRRWRADATLFYARANDAGEQ